MKDQKEFDAFIRRTTKKADKIIYTPERIKLREEWYMNMQQEKADGHRAAQSP